MIRVHVKVDGLSYRQLFAAVGACSLTPALALGPGMGAAVLAHQLERPDPGVDLRGLDVFVAEQGLDVSHVGAGLQEMGREELL